MRFSQPDLTTTEQRLVEKAIQSGNLAGAGEFGARVERMLSETHEHNPALLLTSCTHGLEMSALLLGVGPGDEVIIPSFAFVSVANAFALRGATLVFADIDSSTLSLSVETVRSLVTERTVAICAINYGGVGVGTVALREFCDQHSIWLVEDNAHGLFGSTSGRPLGTLGHLSVTSFHQTKNLVCGEGGAIFINDLSFVGRAEVIREKGTDRASFYRGTIDKYSWRDLGSSWVLSDVLAAMLLGQIERRNEILMRRQSFWDSYWLGLKDWADENQVVIPKPRELLENSSHVFFLIFPNSSVAESFIAHMGSYGIPAVVHYQPLHRSPYLLREADKPVELETTDWVSNGLVRLPLHSVLSETDIQHVVDAVRKFDLNGKT